MNTFRRCFSLSLLTATLFASGLTQAADIETRTIKFPSASNKGHPQAVIVSKKFWDKLSPVEQKILRDAAMETAVYQRKVARDEAAKVLGELKKLGMTVHELPPEEIAKMRERAKPVIEKYTKELGPVVQEMYAAVDKVRAAK